MRKFLVLVALVPRILLAETFYDAADREIHVGDRVLIHGASGYVRTIYALNEVRFGDSINYQMRASHPSFGTWGDDVMFMENSSRIRMIYKSIDTSPYVKVGDRVTFRTIKDGKMTEEEKSGRVIELFTGGHMMVKTGCLSTVAISYNQLVDPSVTYVPESSDGPPYSRHAAEEMVYQRYHLSYPHYNGSWEYLREIILRDHKAEVDEIFALGREVHE